MWVHSRKIKHQQGLMWWCSCWLSHTFGSFIWVSFIGDMIARRKLKYLKNIPPFIPCLQILQIFLLEWKWVEGEAHIQVLVCWVNQVQLLYFMSHKTWWFRNKKLNISFCLANRICCLLIKTKLFIYNIAFSLLLPTFKAHQVNQVQLLYFMSHKTWWFRNKKLNISFCLANRICCLFIILHFHCYFPHLRHTSVWMPYDFLGHFMVENGKCKISCRLVDFVSFAFIMKLCVLRKAWKNKQKKYWMMSVTPKGFIFSSSKYNSVFVISILSKKRFFKNDSFSL
jgi:hypothetical protein